MALIWWTVLGGSIFALAWAYFLYPLLLWVLVSRSGPSPRADIEDLPGVSLILAVFNEEKALPNKLANCLAIEYPAERLEIIVVDDGSTDGTARILRSFLPRGIKAVILPQRAGKTDAQNKAVALAHQPILFFTDATTTHPPDVLRAIVRRFGDPSVGCVSGRAVFRDDGSLTAAGLQIKQRYDVVVRGLQARVRTLFGAVGCVYAVRRDLYVPLRPDLVSDFVEPLKLLIAGYRTVLEPDAIGLVDRPPPDMRREFTRRSRIVLQGLRGLLHVRELLSPRHGVIQAVSLASQRLLRWLTPVFAIGALVSSGALAASHPMPRLLFVLQLAFYGTAVATGLVERRAHRLPRMLALPLYFSLSCLAALDGIMRLGRGETGMTWETTGR